MASKPRKRFAHATILPGEDLATCESARLALHAEFQPTTFQQVQMVDEIASINWYIRREMYCRNMDVVRAYDSAAQSALPGAPKPKSSPTPSAPPTPTAPTNPTSTALSKATSSCATAS